MRTRAAFTLVELMITVAIIGVLASIAIPNVLKHQYQAKRAELPLNVRGIGDSVNAYLATHDIVQEVDYQPDATPGKKLRSWPKNTGFAELGWVPDGDVRGSYKVVELSTTDQGEPFVVVGLTDIDGDKQYAAYASFESMDLHGPYRANLGDAPSDWDSLPEDTTVY